MKTGKKREHAHIANVRSSAETKLELSKISEKNTSRILVFQPGVLQKKQADDFIIEFGSELAELKENFKTFLPKKCMT